jgi:hypothetical protein
LLPVRGSMTCRKQPISCRGQDIAARYGLTPNKRKPWQFEGKCPRCHHGGFSIKAGDQGPNAPRHIWWCNCHRCKCPPEAVRTQMISDGDRRGLHRLVETDRYEAGSPRS